MDRVEVGPYICGKSTYDELCAQRSDDVAVFVRHAERGDEAKRYQKMYCIQECVIAVLRVARPIKSNKSGQQKPICAVASTK